MDKQIIYDLRRNTELSENNNVFHVYLFHIYYMRMETKNSGGLPVGAACIPVNRQRGCKSRIKTIHAHNAAFFFLVCTHLAEEKPTE